MRRSGAPSQTGIAQKRPRFAPPFLENSTIPATAAKPSNTCKSTNAPQVANTNDGRRTANDILNLLENKTSSEQSTEEAEFSPGIEHTLTNDVSFSADSKLPNSRLSRFAPRSSMFEIFDNAGNTVSTGEKGKTSMLQNIPPPNKSASLDRTEKSSQLNGEARSNRDQGNNECVARYFSVMWCKLSKKKHKTWEDDAILIVRGSTAILVDMEGKEIGQESGYKISQLQELADGQLLVIGGKQIQVMGVLSEEQYRSGRCFQTGVPPMEAETAPPESISKPFVNPKKGDTGLNTEKVIKRMTSVLQTDLNDPNVLVMPRPSDSHQWQHNTDHVPVVDVVVESGIGRHLRPHQREGIIFLYQCIMGMKSHRGYGAVLADEMGLGKTLQSIALIWMLLKQGPYGGKPVLRKILIITPGSLVKNWCKEFKKWLNMRVSVFAVGPDKKVEDFLKFPDCPVMIISYEMFVRNVETIRGIKFDLLICDEGHRLKNTNIKTTSYANGLLIMKRIVLTGTPVQNDLQELYSIVDFVNPGVLGTVGAFRHVYEDPILASRQPNASDEELSVGQTRATELNRLTSLFILRRTQEINNQYLPPKADVVLFCALTELQLSLYRKIVSSRAVKSCISDYYVSDAAQHLCCISALKKLCNHPDLLYRVALENATGDSVSEGSEVNKSLYTGLHALFPNDYTNDSDRTQQSSKLYVLSQLLQSFHKSPSERVVVVSNSTKTLDIIEQMCKDLGYSSVRLDGNTAVSKRQQLVDRFNSHHMPDFVFLLSTKAGGVGLNLVGASRLVLYDIDWNPATDLQAMARVWRDGQRKCTYIYRLISTGTIEEKMYQRQISKQGLSGVVVDAKASDTKQTFSPEQLRELFQAPDGSLCSTHDLLNCDCQGGDEVTTKPTDAPLQSTVRTCQLLTKKLSQNNQKNICMDELFEWTHIQGPSPDMTHVDPLFPGDELPQVTFAFWTESNKQEADT